MRLCPLGSPARRQYRCCEGERGETPEGGSSFVIEIIEPSTGKPSPTNAPTRRPIRGRRDCISKTLISRPRPEKPPPHRGRCVGPRWGGDSAPMVHHEANVDYWPELP